MKDEDKIIGKIDRYLKGKLDEDEKIAFQSELNSDEELRKHLQFVVDVSKGVQLSTARQWKQMLNQKETKGNRSGNNRYIAYFTGIAAGILLIIALVFLFTPRDKQYEELFAAHFTPYPNIVSPVQRSEDTTRSAWTLYEQGMYEQAAEYFKMETAGDPGNVSYQFYAGISLLASDKPSQAIDLLQKVEKADTTKFNVQAEWYLGLAYLKSGKINKARSTFKELAAAGNEYAARANQILDEL